MNAKGGKDLTRGVAKDIDVSQLRLDVTGPHETC